MTLNTLIGLILANIVVSVLIPWFFHIVRDERLLGEQGVPMSKPKSKPRSSYGMAYDSETDTIIF